MARYSGQRTKGDCCVKPISHDRVTLIVLWSVLFLTQCCPVLSQPNQRLTGYRPLDEASYGSISATGVFAFSVNTPVNILVYGEGISNRSFIKFTESRETCDDRFTDRIGGNEIGFHPPDQNLTNTSPNVQYRLEIIFDVVEEKTYYFCVDFNGTDNFDHQGSAEWLTIVARPSPLPLWAQIIFIIVLMMMSGLFSGLNLGLMALDPTTLKIIKQSGNRRQRIYAKIIFRFRKHGNYLLCTLLLGNVIVNSTLTILLDGVLPGGIYAVIASTLAIVIFGEIIPQAICSRHGLLIGAWTIPVTFVFMVLTFPLSFPLSLLLNVALGKEVGAVYNRDQLLKLLHVTQEHHDLVEEEVNIISGVLGYKDQLAEKVMTKFEDVFCISIQSVLDFKLMRDIYDSGYSRIPIYEGDKNNIVGLLYVRDLAFVDPDDQASIQAHMGFYKHELIFVWSDDKLGDILKRFISGKCHMGIVQKVNNETEGDPFYENIGVLTLEDIIEEILQQEIVDETDRFTDNQNKKLRKRKDFHVGDFDNPSPMEEQILSSQQRLAVFQFLSTIVEPFKKQFISGNVLKRLLNKNVVRRITLDKAKQTDLCLYTAGKEAGYFTLVLEGCMEVQIGKDNLTFDSKSFTYFGAQVLLNAVVKPQVIYMPDYTVRPSADSIVIIVTKRQYLAAREATRFEGQDEGSMAENTELTTKSKAESEDFFSEKWQMAENEDYQDSQSTGLSSITKFLSRRKVARQNSDTRRLLTQSSSDSFSSPERGPAGLNQVGGEESHYRPAVSDTVLLRDVGAASYSIRANASEPATLRTISDVDDWTLNTSTEV